MCSHHINISNFAQGDSVTYPIVKIIGNIVTVSCEIDNNQNVHLISKENSKFAKLINGNFKFLLHLIEGHNYLKFQFCNETLDMVLIYIRAEIEHAVIPLYVICEGHDGRFQAPRSEENSVESACKRISLCAKLLQCATAEKLYENGCGRKTFFLNDHCALFRSKLNYLEARKMNPEELWKTIGREIMSSSIGSESKKFLAFLSCTKYCGQYYTEEMKTYEDLLKITEGYVALGGGGLALFGTACLYTWPEKFEDIMEKFGDNTCVEKSQFLDDSCYRGSVGACFSTTLGSVLHELFHTFDLGHTENGIMGRGFDNIYKIFVNAVDETTPSCEHSRTFHDKILFKEEFEPGSLSERVLTENKKKEFTVIKRLNDLGDTTLERSCAILLCYHRWFNKPSSVLNSTLSFDNHFKIIKATAGIRVVEIRSLDTEMVLENWVFTGRVLKFSFQIPEDASIAKRGETYIIVVEDSNGYLLREKITF